MVNSIVFVLNNLNRAHPRCVQLFDKIFGGCTHQGNLKLCRNVSIPAHSLHNYAPLRWNSNSTDHTDYLKNIHDKYEQEKEKKQKSYDKWRKYSGVIIPLVLMGGVGMVVNVYGQPEVDSVTGIVFEDKYTGQRFENFYRAYNSLSQWVETDFAEPSRKKLLPDPLQKPYIQPKYTVLIELKDLLVRPEWNFENGWRFKKRPGVEYLLKTIATQHQFEVVVFTSEPAMIANPIVESLNSEGVIMYQLYRDSTHYKGNVYQKDLTRINRDLSKVILIDTDRAKVEPNPENALVLPKWDGNMADRNLYDLAMFLRAIDKTNCSDVRPFLKAYSKEADPLEIFRQRQILLQQKEEEKKKMDKSKIKSKFLSKN